MKCRIKKIPQEGSLYGNSGLQLLGEGSIQQIGSNPFSGDIIQFNGRPHSQGGIDIQYAGTPAEVEGNETAFKDKDGNMQIMGNLFIPQTNTKFKSAFKKIAKQEQKATKLQEKSSKLIDESNPFNPYSGLAFNSGKALQDAAMQKHLKLSQEKEDLAQLQTSILDLAEVSGVKPEKISNIMKYGGKLKAKDGAVLSDNIQNYVQETADIYGLDPNILANLVLQESGGKPGLKSSKGALGVIQMLPNTAKQYGVTKQELLSNRSEDIRKTVDAAGRHFQKLLVTNGNDYILALAAYNGGQGAVDFVKQKTNNPNITGEDWLSFMQERRYLNPSQKPSAWQNETYDYVRNVFGNRTPQNTVPLPQTTITARRPNNSIPTIQLSDGEVNGFRLPQVDRDAEMAALNAQYPSAGMNPASFGVFGDNTPSPQYSDISPTGESSTQPRKRLPSLADRNRLRFTDFIPEVAALFDRPDYVQGQYYQPELYQPYQVSFQDRLNENNASFRSLERQLANNPAALSTLAAQRYSANNQVLGEQFRTNQAISNDVINRNTDLLNQANLTNIQLADQQAVRQAQAKANTDAGKRQALASISNKIAQHRQENNNIRLIENLSNYRLDKNFNAQYMGPEAQFYLGDNNPTKTITKIDKYGNTTIQQVEDPYTEALKQQQLLDKQRAARKNTFKFGGIMKKMNKSKS